MNTKVNEGKLINGKDALIALANGENLQYRFPDGIWMDFTNNLNTSGSSLRVVDLLNDYACFRLKPRTILINGIEVPAPFLPEEDELFYHVSPEYEKGYAKSMAHEGNETTWQQFGAWRTEEGIKQVVAALRQVFGGSHDN